MPWSQTSPIDQKTQFIAAYLRDRLSVTELYGVSHKTGYKWIDRSLMHGPQGLEERSRRPSTSPRHTPDHVVAAILEARRRHPSWGAKKLLSILCKRHPRWPWPARSTVCDILRRHGLVPKKRKRRVIGHPGAPTSSINAPNDVWSADFKGHFKTGDGYYCDPLTITDGYSRFLLSCQALSSTSVAEAKPVFLRVFKEFSLPRRIRTDNGVPSPPIPWPGCPSCPRGGSAWASCLSASNPVHPNRMVVTSACIAPCKPKPPDRLAPTFAPSSRSLTTSAKSSTMSGRTRRSTCAHPPRAMTPPHVPCPTNCTARVSRPLRGPLRQRQRWHSVEPSMGQCLNHLRRGICRSRGNRWGRLECLLRPPQTRSAARTPYAHRRGLW
jgi:transposase